MVAYVNGTKWNKLLKIKEVFNFNFAGLGLAFKTLYVPFKRATP